TALCVTNYSHHSVVRVKCALRQNEGPALYRLPDARPRPVARCVDRFEELRDQTLQSESQRAAISWRPRRGCFDRRLPCDRDGRRYDRDLRSAAGGERADGGERLAAGRPSRGRREVLVRTPLPRLHAITDERIARRADLPDIARELAKGGGSELAFHARGRSLSGREHYELAVRLSDGQTVRLFVNDRLDVALSVPAAGVQL